MKWVPRHFTLPILLGVSLTGVGIALIYLLYKKDEEDINTQRNHIEVAKRISIECKVPRQFVPAVIGRGGSVIKDVQSKTGTQIFFKEDNIECPDRVCIIRGTYESVHLAEELIKSIIANQPIIETYEIFVPQKACGWIIGKGGATVQQIQTTTNAKITIEGSYNPYDPNGKRRIIIKGTAEQIAAALLQIEDKVREEKEARANLEASSAARLPRGKLSPRNTAVNATEHSQPAEPLSLKITDGIMEVYVSAMENPSQFWVQVIGPGITALDKLVSEMTAYYNEEESHELHALKNITLGQIVAAKYNFDERWYRAEVISDPDDGQCEVYFVDYGDHEVVQIDCVLELRTDFLSLRLQAVECSLANIKPRQREWSAEACNRFAELTWVAQWKVLVAKVRGYKERALSYGRSRREGSPIPRVDLFEKNEDTDINIGQELINEGLVDSEETPSSAASSTLSPGRSSEMTTVSSSATTSPLARRAFSPETPANTSNLTNLTMDSSLWTDKSLLNLETSSNVENVDLITPQLAATIEEIDLVTPAKDETSRFIESERKVSHEDANGQHGRPRGSKMRMSKMSQVAPAGYESDLSDDSDELELGFFNIKCKKVIVNVLDLETRKSNKILNKETLKSRLKMGP
ncbi:tudor and KH domain containing protein papi isoform X2 [Andrena cerasifolii]|uniref:tudor and KH domain containing protein papi isoform X2 n=1 Tax=Andrena cerasifolii TaxID=2819439 RepID=UPI0040380F60